MTSAGSIRHLPAVLALDDDTRVPARTATPEQFEQAASYITEQAAMKIEDDIELARWLRALAARARERGLAHVAELGAES